MLIGYDIDGNIKFIFTDDNYLNKLFPNNTAKISNFWKIRNPNLKEFFIQDSINLEDISSYHIVSSKLTKKNCQNIEVSKIRCIDRIINTSESKEKIRNKNQIILETKSQSVVNLNAKNQSVKLIEMPNV